MRVKQVRQTCIILLLFGSIVFSVIICQGVNLIKQMLISRYEQEGKKNVKSIVNAQSAYRVDNYRFSNSIEELGLVTNTENYNYQIHREIQIDSSTYTFFALDNAIVKSLKIPKDEFVFTPQKLPKISKEILMISGQTKKVGSKTFVGFIFSCREYLTGGVNCSHESLTFSMLYESKQPSTPPRID